MFVVLDDEKHERKWSVEEDIRLHVIALILTLSFIAILVAVAWWISDAFYTPTTDLLIPTINLF